MPARLEPPVPDGVSFLAALLMRFPQVATVAFDPATGSLRLVLLLRRRLPAGAFLAFRQRVEDAVNVYFELDRAGRPDIEVRRTTEKNITRVEVVRGVDDLTCEEIEIIARIAEERFGEDLILAESDDDEEARYDHEDNLRYALEHARDLRLGRPLIGLRERGRVLIYYTGQAPRRAREA
ncbi:MAG: hypothetical protein FJX78_09370 [Armatimonadetes bacterium]|nr:hypothetical protein [Armatimonadota bacterium]